MLGYPIKKSFSRVFQNAAFDALKIPARYYAIETKLEELEQTIIKLKEKNFGGWNCTLPLKIQIMPLLDEISPSAKILGAVNTVVNDRGKLRGFNTDADGWVKAIREDFNVDVRDLRIMILGVGGAGSALATQAALEKCPRLVLVNRTYERAQSLAEKLRTHYSENLSPSTKPRLLAIPWDEQLIAQELSQIDLLVNATSAGMQPSDPPLLSAEILKSHLLVYDTIYQPLETKFLQEARQIGAKTANGLNMLLHQGALAFTLWTGKEAPLAQMREALHSAINLSEKKE